MKKITFAVVAAASLALAACGGKKEEAVANDTNATMEDANATAPAADANATDAAPAADANTAASTEAAPAATDAKNVNAM
mgnify:CR=1 FL=1